MEKVRTKQKKKKVKHRPESESAAEDIEENVVEKVVELEGNAEVHDVPTQDDILDEIAEEMLSSPDISERTPNEKVISEEKQTVVTDAAIETPAPIAPTYKELSDMINQMQMHSLTSTEVGQSSKVATPKLVNPFTFEELEELFGMREIAASRTLAAEFDERYFHTPSSSHPLYEALSQYMKARSQVISNQKEISILSTQCDEKLKAVWVTRNLRARGTFMCSDGMNMTESHEYLDAVFQKSVSLDLQKETRTLRNNATEIHSLHSHSECLLKIQVDDLLWTAVVTGSDLMRDALSVLFFVIRSSGWGFDKHLRQQLRNWYCILADNFLKVEKQLNGTLFILHHLLRLPQGIKWAVHLIQCEVNEFTDIHQAFCLLETILILCNKSKVESKKRIDSESDDFVVACEAIDENMWMVVDSDGEGADAENVGAQSQIVLKETDIIGLLQQIPFEKLFKELMFVKENNNDLIFCGGNLGGASILKIFTTVRIFLNIIRNSLIINKHYLELSKELCRFALHSVMYCTDLWDVANSQCEADFYERLSIEYNNIVIATISTLECAGSREISTMFISEIPFSLCRDDILYNFYEKISKELIVSDSIWCYYTLVTISNMAISRRDETFKLTAIRRLFEIGFTSDFADLGCGEWARTLCGVAIQNDTEYIDLMLNCIPGHIPEKWLSSIPLSSWRPNPDEILSCLMSWKKERYRLLPHLLTSLDWTPQSGISQESQRSVAKFLSDIAEQNDQMKRQLPEWLWECLLLLRFHNSDWKHPSNANLTPEALGMDTSGRVLLTNAVILLATSWGHSLPLIFQHGGVFLLKLANHSRVAEVIHILHYVIPRLADSPEEIKHDKSFKELLILIFKDEKTWQKMTTRLVNRDFPGPNVKALVESIQMQLGNFQQYGLSSPCSIMSVWIHWLTSLDNWQSDWLAVYLLDQVLGCCFFHFDAMAEASKIFRTFIQLPTSPKTQSSSSFGSWLWNSSSTFKGLIQCSIEAPFVWHLALWMEHITIERDLGLWQRLIEKLSMHKEGNKVNIDKTFKSVGGSDNSGILVIYRSISCAINTSFSHPIYSLLWQLFFYLYMDISFLHSSAFQPKPVGPLFFEGIINSKLMTKAKTKLSEAKRFYENEAEKAKDSNVSQDQQSYYLQQAELMETFLLWLSDNFFVDMSRIYSHPHHDKLKMLMRGENVIWTHTINMFEYNKYQLGINVNRKTTLKHKISSGSNKIQPRNQSPDDRIFQRLKTYESPTKTANTKFKDVCLVPIIDPKLINGFLNILTVIKSNINDISKLSKVYCNMVDYFNSVDSSLHKLLPDLYKKRKFFISVTKKCGPNCTGSAKIIVQGEESIFDKNIDNALKVNRENHQKMLNKAIQSYANLSAHTKMISKLSQMICSESINIHPDDGVKIFYVILKSLNSENLQCPPVNNILNTVAAQLGEKFIRISGTHSATLIRRMKEFGNEALISSLLRPLELTNTEMLTMYNIVNVSISDPQVAFSCLSKFRISAWLRDTRPSVTDRSLLIAHICDALALSGCNPPTERTILQELLCVHLSHILAWEFPVHLNQVLSHFHSLTLEKKLPVDCWEHCFAVFEKYSHMVSSQQACMNMDSIGRNWWTKRGTWGLNGLYDQYGPYTQSMARLGALLTSSVLNASMIQQPLLLTHQITSVVFNAMCAFWNVWLVPRWETPQAAWSGDYSRSPPLMPWSPEENSTPDAMLEAFVETLIYCIETLPGSTNDYLRLTWQWYFSNFPNITVGSHVLTRVHKTLSALPWCTDASHWITYSELQCISKVCSLPLPSCHNFILNCLGNRPWQSWLSELPSPMQPTALCYLLPIVIKLRVEQKVVNDVALLSWGLVKAKNYEEILLWFMNSVNTPSEPFYNNDFFPLICIAGGLKNNCDSGEDWQCKQMCLVKEWVNALSSLVDSKNDDNQKTAINKEVSSSIINLLVLIENTSMTLANATNIQKMACCTSLLNTAIMMLNISNLQDLASTKWIEWITKAQKMCIESMISCVLNITHNAIFSNLAEHTLTIFFNLKGDWSFVLSHWKYNCHVPVDALINGNSLLAAFTTYKSLNFESHQGKTFELIDKVILNSLVNIVPSSTYENQLLLWVMYMVSLSINLYIDEKTKESVLYQVMSTLEKWSEEPGLWKTYIQNVAPSQKFRIVTKYAYCAIALTYDNLSNSPRSSKIDMAASQKFLSSLNSTMEQKQNSSIKHIMEDHLKCLQEKSKNVQLVSKNVVEMCSKLYSDVHYLSMVRDAMSSEKNPFGAL